MEWRGKQKGQLGEDRVTLTLDVSATLTSGPEPSGRQLHTELELRRRQGWGQHCQSPPADRFTDGSHQPSAGGKEEKAAARSAGQELVLTRAGALTGE